MNRRGFFGALGAGAAAIALTTRLARAHVVLVDDPPKIVGQWDGLTLKPGDICYAPDGMYASYEGYGAPNPPLVMLSDSPDA